MNQESETDLDFKEAASYKTAINTLYNINFHWHHDFEYNILLEGNVNYYINDTHIRLEKGDVLFINSNILHMGRQAENSEDSVMYTLTLSTNLLSVCVLFNLFCKNY